MTLSCSRYNITAHVQLQKFNTLEVVLTDMSRYVGDPQRVTVLAINEVAKGSDYQLEWSDSGLYLLIASRESSLIILNVSTMEYCTIPVGGVEGVTSVTWLTNGILPNLMVGCHAFAAITTTGKLLVGYQQTTSGPFATSFHGMTKSSHAKKPLLCHRLQSIGHMLYGLRMASDKLFLDAIHIHLWNGKVDEKTVLEVSWKGATSQQFRIISVDYDRTKNCLYIFSSTETCTLQVCTWSLADNRISETTVDCQRRPSSENFVCDIIFGDFACVLFDNGAMEALSLNKMTIMDETTKLVSPRDDLFYRESKVSSLCLSPNRCLLYGLGEQGDVVSWILKPMDLTKIIDSFYQDRSYEDILVAVRDYDSKAVLGLIDGFGPSLRRSFQCGLIVSLSLRSKGAASERETWESLCWFFQNYLVVNHFWECIVASTNNIRLTIDCLESCDDKIADDLSIDPSALHALVPLALAFISSVTCLFSPEAPHRDLLHRALCLTRIHGRFVTALIMLKVLLKHLAAQVDKYQETAASVSSYQTLHSYYSDLVNQLQTAVASSDLDIDVALQKLSSGKTESTLQTGSSLSLLLSPVSTAECKAMIEAAASINLRKYSSSNALDLVTGSPLRQFPIDRCSGCLKPHQSNRSNDALSCGFTFDYWTYCCPCSAPIRP